MVTGVVDALDRLTVKAACAVPEADGSAAVTPATETPGGVVVGVVFATPLSCRPVTADPAAPVVAWKPNDALWPLASFPFHGALVTT